jgi:hypothetical protein
MFDWDYGANNFTKQCDWRVISVNIVSVSCYLNAEPAEVNGQKSHSSGFFLMSAASKSFHSSLLILHGLIRYL